MDEAELNDLMWFDEDYLRDLIGKENNMNKEELITILKKFREGSSHACALSISDDKRDKAIERHGKQEAFDIVIRMLQDEKYFNTLRSIHIDNKRGNY